MSYLTDEYRRQVVDHPKYGSASIEELSTVRQKFWDRVAAPHFAQKGITDQNALRQAQQELLSGKLEEKINLSPSHPY